MVNNNYQLIATILVDVCYRNYGEVRMKQMSTRGNGLTQLRRRRGIVISRFKLQIPAYINGKRC